jgi:hypothetical protein
MKMAKIIDLPSLRKLTEHDRKEFLMQLFETRDKLTNVLGLLSNKEVTTDSRQRLLDELMTVESMLATAGEVIRSAYTRKK